MSGRSVHVFWFRRDLRLNDHHGLYKALKDHGNVLPLFIFDTEILDQLEERFDMRVDLIHRALTGIQEQLVCRGSSLMVLHGKPLESWEELLAKHPVASVSFVHDHEPYALERDSKVAELLRSKGIAVSSVKDISVFERGDILKDDGKPYTVFTPYMKKWRAAFSPSMIQAFPSENLFDRFWKSSPDPLPSLEQLGFRSTAVKFPELTLSDGVLENYDRDRDIPGVDGTSRMSVPLRFGFISVRELYRRSIDRSPKYMNELIWREFFMQILWHFPHPERAFKPAYDRIPWRADEVGFQAWCEGRTGYPLVDAGMRELNRTGLMHNRVRMVVSSFLTKHLLIDWRWGEAYFAAKLLDFELSSNNGGWQWASGSGCDAAPYFRVFNPRLQMERFDPSLNYVKEWVPEYGTGNYPAPLVVHEVARQRAIATYRSALSETPKGSN